MKLFAWAKDFSPLHLSLFRLFDCLTVRQGERFFAPAFVNHIHHIHHPKQVYRIFDGYGMQPYAKVFQVVIGDYGQGGQHAVYDEKRHEGNQVGQEEM